MNKSDNQIQINEKSSKNFGMFIKNLKFFTEICFGTGKIFLITLFSLVITAFVTLIIPIAFRFLIDKGINNNLEQKYIFLFGVLVCALAFGTALRYYSVTVTGERVYNQLRLRIFKALLAFSEYEFNHLNIADILSRMMSDTETIREFTGSSLSIAARNLLLLCGGLTMMLYTDFLLTFMALLIIPLVLVPIMTLGRSLKGLSIKSQEKLAESNQILNETLYALSTVQNFTQEQNRFNIFKSLSDVTYNISKQRIFKRAILTFCIIALVFGAVLTLLIYGSIAVKNGTMSAGEFTQFVLYSIFTAGAAASLSEVMGASNKVQAAYNRLNDLLIIEPKIKNNPNPLTVDQFHSIHFKKICFQYDTRSVPSLLDIDLLIKKGQKIALVGLSGSGKTTLIKLLLREINRTSGELLWNTIPIEHYNIAKIRQEITYISQNITLFTGTILDNIRFGNPNATMADIIKAASDAQLHHDIIALPHGYDSMIGERGFQLSGGQRQRLAIARGLLKNASIWILDEPTAALDSETEAKFLRTLSDLTFNKTVITVTHRLTTLSKMDMIYVLEHGKIIEHGTHDALWHNPTSRYREFVNYTKDIQV